MNIIKRYSWSELRSDYYIAARTLHISGNYRMSGIMFGYAIECSMKHALVETGFEDKNILHGHNIDVLFSNCISQNIFTDIKVSNDFIHYINDFFKPRYPSLQEKVVNKTFEEDKFLLKSIDFLPFYDDLMIQLDDALLNYTNDVRVSVGFRASMKILQYYGRIFYHCNYPACFRIEKYKGILLNENNIDPRFVEEFEKGTEYLWNCQIMYHYVKMNKNVNIDYHPASFFTYPKWITKDGKKCIELRLPINTNLSGNYKFTPDTSV